MLNAADIKRLQDLEEMLWRPKTRFDSELMEKVFAPDLMEYGRSGRRYERADLLLEESERQDFDATLPLPEFKARALSETVALTTYISEVQRGDIVERSNRSSIWIRQGESWQLRFHQGTPTDQV